MCVWACFIDQRVDRESSQCVAGSQPGSLGRSEPYILVDVIHMVCYYITCLLHMLVDVSVVTRCVSCAESLHQ